MNHRAFIEHYADLLARARHLPAPCAPSPSCRTPLRADAPRALLFSPHPDDETLTGALALRLRREHGFRVINCPLSLGSDPELRHTRADELARACDWLGFELREVPRPVPSPLRPPEDLASPPASWLRAIQTVRGLIRETAPLLIALPHRHDEHPAHLATHLLVLQALENLPLQNPWLLQTEFWQPMQTPNLLVESSTRDVTELTEALTFHQSQITRNPYHLALSARMVEAAQRGSERLLPIGSPALGARFATLYHLACKADNAIPHRPFQPADTPLSLPFIPTATPPGA